METKYDVFISYSRKDTEIANKICEALKQQGISFFIDRKGIKGGQEVPELLADAIVNCRIMLYLASINSYNSKYTNNEITFAFNEKPKGSIIPYIIDDSNLPNTQRFIFASINIRTIKEHPIETILMQDMCQLLNREYKDENTIKSGIASTQNIDEDTKREIAKEEAKRKAEEELQRIKAEKKRKETKEEVKRKAEEELQRIRTEKQRNEARDIKIQDNSEKKKEDYNAKLEGTRKDSRFSDEICEQIVKKIEKPHEIRFVKEKACTAFKYNTYRNIKEFWPFGLSILVFIGVICYGIYDEQIWKYNNFSDIAFSLFCWSFVAFLFSSTFFYIAEVLIVFTAAMGCKKGSIAFTFFLLILITICIIIWECN